MANPIEFKGIAYRSLKELCNKFAVEGVSYECVSGRIKDRWDLERALNEPQNKNERKIYRVGDIEYPSLRSLAKDAGISYEAAVKRSHRGWTDNEIFYGKLKEGKTKVKIKKVLGTVVNIDGIEYGNLRVAYEQLNVSVSYNTVRARLRYGWSHQEALGFIDKVDGRKLPKDKKIRKPKSKMKLIVDNVEYASVAALASAFHLPYKLVYNRINVNNWSCERAVMEPVSDQVTVNGKVFRSATKAWETIGKTNWSTYEGRKLGGHSLEVCLGLKPLPSLDRYEVFGVVYSTIAEVANAVNMKSSQLSGRLQTMTLEEAIEYVPANGRYTEARFREDPNLAAATGTFYFIKIESKDGLLHKIGITLKPIERRFQSTNFELIDQYSGKMFDLYKIEQEILSEFKENLHRGDEDFDGRTETFLLMAHEELEMLKTIAHKMTGIA